MKYLPSLLLLCSCVGAPDRWNVEYGTGDGSIDGRKGGEMDTDMQWVALGVSGAIGGKHEKLQPAPPPPPIETACATPDAVPPTFADVRPFHPELEPKPLPWVPFGAGVASTLACVLGWKKRASIKRLGGFFGGAAALLVMLSGCATGPVVQGHFSVPGAVEVLVDTHRNVFAFGSVVWAGEITVNDIPLLAGAGTPDEWVLRVDGRTYRGHKADPLPAAALKIKDDAYFAALGLTVDAP